jgi:hypothetical protein
MIFGTASHRSPRQYFVAAALAAAVALSLQGASFVVGHQALPARMLRVADPSNPAGGDEFDGQFFLALARDPLVRHATAERLDSPALRARRIGLPLVAWLLAPLCGGAAAGLLLAETTFLLLLIALTQSEARRQGLPPLLCLTLPLLLPFVLSVELVTAELPTAVMLLLSTHEHRRGHRGSSLAALAAACLFKEVAVLAVAALAARSLLQRRFQECLLRLVCMVPLIGWQTYLWFRFPETTGISGLLSNLAPPGQGLLAAVSNPLSGIVESGLQLKQLALLAAVIWYLAGGALALLLLKAGASDGRLIACIGTALVVFLSYGGSAQAYNEIFNFGRQLFLVVVGIIAILFQETPSLSDRGRSFAASWITVGSILGILWWGHEIVTSRLGL